jgi:hypothetical protein
MKKLIFVVAVLTVVAFAFGAMAQTTSPAKPAPADVWNAAVGVLEKIDAAAKTLEVKTMVKAPKMPAVEKMMTFATDNKTKIFKLVEERKEKKLSFADLKTGQTLWITYKVEAGKNIAKTIEVR